MEQSIHRQCSISYLLSKLYEVLNDTHAHARAHTHTHTHTHTHMYIVVNRHCTQAVSLPPSKIPLNLSLFSRFKYLWHRNWVVVNCKLVVLLSILYYYNNVLLSNVYPKNNKISLDRNYDFIIKRFDIYVGRKSDTVGFIWKSEVINTDV